PIERCRDVPSRQPDNLANPSNTQRYVRRVVDGASGAYMLMFSLSHVSAVGRARYLRHTDTNWRWLTADDLLTDPWSARLLPYYILGVLAFGLHLACDVRAIARA